MFTLCTYCVSYIELNDCVILDEINYAKTSYAIVPKKPIKGVISKFWNFLYYWSDLTEIFTQYVKSEKKHFLFMNIFPFRAWFFIYIQIYIYNYIYKKE